MKHTLKVDQVRDGLWLDSDITYTQVPGWLGNTTRDLKLSVIRHFQTNDDIFYYVNKILSLTHEYFGIGISLLNSYLCVFCVILLNRVNIRLNMKK